MSATPSLRPVRFHVYRRVISPKVCPVPSGAGQPQRKAPNVNLDARQWEVRLDFDTVDLTTVDKVDQLVKALQAQPEVHQAHGTLADRHTAVSTGANIVLIADAPGDAINDAIRIFTTAAAATGIALKTFREATVADAALDPRD
jgi:hypothetical protein